MNPYNGFTGVERQLSWDIQKVLINKGKMVMGCCEMCQQSEGLIMPHLENYDRPLDEYYPLCVECHMNLHGRFKSPGGWFTYLLKLREGYKPKIYEKVAQYFNSAASNEFWRNKFKTPIFIARPGVWYENLLMEEIDYRLVNYPPAKESENTKEMLLKVKRL